jgi:hypothetical protein
MCSKFTIYGERCSGTTYLEEMMLNNFNISVTWNYGWKHFFGFQDFKGDEEENDTLFICIVRDPVDWIESFYREQHHLIHTNNLNEFLTRKVISFTDNNMNKVVLKDINYTNGKLYKNLFELRFYKNYYLLNILPKKVKNYILIRYEDLSKSPIETMIDIKNKFNLNMKENKIKNVKYYKKEKNKEYHKKKSNISKFEKYLIRKEFNIIQERKLGYM